MLQRERHGTRKRVNNYEIYITLVLKIGEVNPNSNLWRDIKV